VLFKKTQTKPEEVANSETLALVKVNLKTLVNLAPKAAFLNLHKTGIRSQQSGGYLSRMKGRGMEFDEVRLYQAGDDIRSIDWRVTARTGKTHTKVFQEERERPVFISVDNRKTMHFATRGVFKSVQAAKLAALIAWTAQRHGDRIGGQIFSDNSCRELKPQNGKHGVLRFFNSLVNPVELQNTPMSFEHVLARLNQHAKPGSLIYLISDFRGFNPQAEQLLLRLARHCSVVLVFVYDPLEKALPEQGRYRFANEKNEITIDASDKSRLFAYQKRFQLQVEYLLGVAKKNGLQLIQCDTSENPLECLR